MIQFIKNIVTLPLAAKALWCYFMHIPHHINDETIMQKDGECKWYCTKCKKGWRE